MTDNERHEALSEARLFAIAAPMILPLIERRIELASQKLQSAFRSGETNFIAQVAELTTLSDLRREVLQKEQIYNTMEKSK